MRPPSAAFESTALGFFDLHFWKDETAAAEFAPLLAKRWPAAVQPPVPESEDEHAGKPELCAGRQELNRCFLVCAHARDQETNRCDQSQGDDRANDDPKHAVPGKFAHAMGDNG